MPAHRQTRAFHSGSEYLSDTYFFLFDEHILLFYTINVGCATASLKGNG
ncbi:hypothetical protein GGQ62_003078 [Polymorphobacter fuscus]|nr:hypothetical protein [Polymorphobacter fuscus]